MGEITAALVKELREATNLGMMECKGALVDADGDKAKAIRLLRERGMAIAQKKASRSAKQGLVASVIKEEGKVGSLVEVNCETDFVARNENFIAFVNKLAEKACDIDGSLAEVVKNELGTKIAEIGENIVVRRNIRYVLEGKGVVASYIHLGAKLGVLLEVDCQEEDTAVNDTFKDTVKDITMHIAACNPLYLNSDDVPEDVVASEREIYAAQVPNKPANIVDKIVFGKMKKFYAQTCLLQQGFVKEPKQSISAFLQANGKKLHDVLSVRRFVCYQLG